MLDLPGGGHKVPSLIQAFESAVYSAIPVAAAVGIRPLLCNAVSTWVQCALRGMVRPFSTVPEPGESHEVSDGKIDPRESGLLAFTPSLFQRTERWIGESTGLP